VETGALVEAPLQEFTGPCELGLTVTGRLEMVAATESLLLIASAAVRLGLVRTAAVDPTRPWILGVFSIDIGR